MTAHSFQDVVQVLRARLGSRWVGREGEGRSVMVKILKDELGYDSSAGAEIDALVQAGTLRYHRPSAGQQGQVSSSSAGEEQVPITGLPTGGGTLAGAPLPSGDLANTGYWQIGPDEDDTPGRAGQVNPRY